MTSELEALVRDLIRRELDVRLPQVITEPLTGTVVGVPDSSRFLLATLEGTSTPVPIYRPALPSTPRTGDRIAVSRGERGYLVVDKVLDRDPDPFPEVPEPEDHDLPTHIGLGLALDADLDTHAAADIHVRTYYTPSIGSAAGRWSQLGTVVIAERYGSVSFHALVHGGGSNSATWTRAEVRGRIRQQAAFGSMPSVVLEMYRNADITGADVQLVVTDYTGTDTDSPGPTLASVWVRLSRTYEWASWTPVWTVADRAEVEWTGCQAFQPSLPTGVAIAAVNI